jgi:hypothetical protein
MMTSFERERDQAETECLQRSQLANDCQIAASPELHQDFRGMTWVMLMVVGEDRQSDFNNHVDCGGDDGARAACPQTSDLPTLPQK